MQPLGLGRRGLAPGDWQRFGFAGPRAGDFERLAAARDEPAGGVPRLREPVWGDRAQYWG